MIPNIKIRRWELNLFPIDIKSLTGVTQDNRKVKSGYLFAALQGEHADGRDYIDDVLKRGAAVILSDKSVQLPDNSNATLMIAAEPRKEFSRIVADFYKKQPENVIAVTGTNGKTSVAYFINQLWHALDKNSVYYGTLSGTMTTPDPEFLHDMLAQMSDDGVTHVALEASSQGLEQYRMDGVRVSIAAFTNLSQDHLDYHHNMGDYFNAKKRLFSEILDQDGVAVLNADIAQYKELAQICHDRNVRVISYGENAKEMKLESCKIAGLGQNIVIKFRDVNYSAHIPLIGRFQVMNILCALACIVGQGEDIEQYINMFEKVESVPGRLQYVSSDDGSLNAYIDYAHTPDALENALKSLRPHTKGILICVFGCGGDRDKSKRKMMGDIADKYADIVIVTDDNPRSENPNNIRKDIISGVNSKNIHEIADRREAIGFAVNKLSKDGVLLVAGKGHEQGQVFDGYTEPFDDVYEVKTAMVQN